MDYMVLDKNTEETLRSIRRHIRRLQNWGSIDSLSHLGLDASRQVGASFVSLKTLAARYTPDATLAEALWRTRRREEQILACFLFPQGMNKEKITQLMPACAGTEIAEYMGSLWLSGHPDIKGIAGEWADSPEPLLQIAALCAAARHLVLHKSSPQLSEDFLRTLASKEYPDKYVRLVAARYQ